MNSWYKTSHEEYNMDSDEDDVDKYLSMINKSAYSYRNFPEKIKKNIEIARLAMRDPDIYQYLPPEFKSDIEFATIAMQNSYNYRFLPPEFQSNIEFATLAMKYSPNNYNFLPPELKYNMEFAKLAMELPSMYFYLPPELKSNIEFATLAMKYNGNYYKYLPEELKSNMEFASLAMNKDLDNYQYLSPELKLNIEFAEAAMNNDPSNYRHLPEEFKKDINFATLAVTYDPDNYELLLPELKLNIELARLVMQDNPYNYELLPPELKLNIELATLAMKSIDNYFNLPQELKDNKEFMNSINKFKIESLIRYKKNLEQAEKLEKKYPDKQPFEIAQMAGMNVVVYHGTSERNLKFAKDAGGFTSPRYLSHLLEKSDKKNNPKIKKQYDDERLLDPNKYEKRPHAKDQVFLTTNYRYSIDYARRAYGQDGSRPVVIRLEIPLTSVLEFQILCGKHENDIYNLDINKLNDKIINKNFGGNDEQYSYYNEHSNFYDIVNSDNSKLSSIIKKLNEIGRTELTVETFVPYGDILDVQYLATENEEQKTEQRVEKRRETRKRSMEESWYKTSGAEDFFGGMENHEFSEKIKSFPKNPDELTTEQRKFIDSKTNSSSYLGIKEKTDLFLRYPNVANYDLESYSEYLAYDKEGKEIKSKKIWKLIIDRIKNGNYGFNKIPGAEHYPLPDYVYKFIIKEKEDFITSDYFSNNYFYYKRKYPLFFQQYIEKRFSLINHYLSKVDKSEFIDEEELFSNMCLLISEPTLDNVEMFFKINNYCFRRKKDEIIDRSRDSKEGIKEKEEKYNSGTLKLNYSALIFSELLEIEEKKLNQLLEVDNSLRTEKYAIRHVKTGDFVAALREAENAFNARKNYSNKEFAIRVHHCNVNDYFISYIFLSSYQITKNNLLKIINECTYSSSSETSISFDDSEIGINGETYIKGNICLRPYNIKRELYVNDDKNMFSNSLFNSAKGIKSSDKFNYCKKKLDEIMQIDPNNFKNKNIFLNYICSKAMEESYKIHGCQYQIVDSKVIDNMESTTDYVSNSVSDYFLKYFMNLYSNLPNSIKREVEEEFFESKRSFSDDYTVRLNSSFILCSGLFSPKLIECLIKRNDFYPKDIVERIKSNSGDPEADKQMVKSCLEKLNINKKKTESDIESFLSSESNFLFSIDDFPDLFSYCYNFLKSTISSKKAVYRSGEEFNKIDFTMNELKKVRIFIIDAKRLIDHVTIEGLENLNVSPYSCNGFYSSDYRISGKSGPTIVVFRKNQESNEMDTIINLLGLVPFPDNKELSVSEQKTLWHEMTHAMVDKGLGGTLAKEIGYGETMSSWMTDVEEVFVISNGNLQFIRNRIAETVNRRFPTDPKMISGYIDNLKSELIEDFPLEFFGMNRDLVKKELDTYVREELPEIMDEMNLDSVRESIIDTFTDFFLGKEMRTKFESYKRNQKSTYDFPTDKKIPEVYDNYSPNQKDQIITNLSQRKDYQDFISNVSNYLSTNPELKEINRFIYDKNSFKMSPIFTIHDLINLIYDKSEGFYGINDLAESNNNNRLNEDIVKLMSPKLLEDIMLIIREEIDKNNQPIFINEGEMSAEEAEEFGREVSKNRRNLGPGWEWIASKKSWYKTSAFLGKNGPDYKTFVLDMEDDIFIHFTSRKNAESIAETGMLFGGNTNFAVSLEYGLSDPNRQYLDQWGYRYNSDEPKKGLEQNDVVGFVFMTRTPTNSSTLGDSGNHAVEVSWSGPVEIEEWEIVSFEEGVKLIENSNIPEEYKTYWDRKDFKIIRDHDKIKSGPDNRVVAFLINLILRNNINVGNSLSERKIIENRVLTNIENGNISENDLIEIKNNIKKLLDDDMRIKDNRLTKTLKEKNNSFKNIKELIIFLKEYKNE